ncbi:MAG: AAA family ATPase [Candidatus Omnitrophica bacterium]|nr:AAA family ATPase [Candidatus Omnitrophota bacterium]
MYEKFYRFEHTPFNMTPDSKFFYPSQKHEEALSRLLVAISQRNGFAVVTGEIGSGKTTVCRTLLNKLDTATKVALILNTHLTRKELLTTILEDLNIEYKSGSKTHLLSALNDYLLERAKDGVNVVIIIDEAQNLTPSVLEEVRMLSNLETEEEKLLQIILIGQPELKKKLSHPNMIQFSQRIVFYYHLEPLDYNETKEYIRHRIHKAGCLNETLFTALALDAVYGYSQGIPRLINLICHNALLNGFISESTIITASHVKEAAEDLLHNIHLKEPEKETKKVEIQEAIKNTAIIGPLAVIDGQ